MDLADLNRKIMNIKSNPRHQALRKKDAKADPFEQFVIWFNEALQFEPYPANAMVLATVDEKGEPDARVVLLKELESHCFIFYTNYESKKAKQLSKHNAAALNFYWPHTARQVRIRGKVKKVERSKSESYFATRPRETQLGAQAWIQSTVLANREELNTKFNEAEKKFSGRVVPCPDYWGGYALVPFEYEFFQSRDWRAHDRLLYILENQRWKIMRLAP